MSSHPKQVIHLNSKAYPQNKLHHNHIPHLTLKHYPPPKPRPQSTYKWHPKNRNKMDLAYRPRLKTKYKLNTIHNWQPKYLKQILHSTNKIPKHNSQPILKHWPPPKPKFHSNFKKHPKNTNNMDLAYRPRHKNKYKLNLTHNRKPNPTTRKL